MTPSRPLLVLLTGDAAPQVRQRHGNFDEMFIRLGRLSGQNYQIVAVARGEKPQSPSAYSGVLVTGSPAMVTDHEDWSEATAAWLREAVAAGLPIFAVCYGHQLLAYALGGEVAYLVDGIEMGTHTITLKPEAAADPMLSDLPQRFSANLLHSQTVVKLPPGAKALASSQQDQFQIIRYSPTAISTQFHPEFDGATMRAFVERERQDQPGLRNQRSEDTPEAVALMLRFIADCGRG